MCTTGSERRATEVAERHDVTVHTDSPEAAAGAAVREVCVGRVRRCVAAGLLAGGETDIAHALLALAQGLAAQETAGWLGTSKRSMDRRWGLAFRAILDGLAPDQS